MKRRFTKITYLLGISVFVLSSCNKTETAGGTTGPIDVNGTHELVAPSDFNWSASLKESLVVNFDNRYRVSLNNELVHLVDEYGNILAKTAVTANSAQFDLRLPQDANYYVEFPKTGDRKLVSGGGTLEMDIKPQGVLFAQKTGSSLACVNCGTPFENGGVEQPVITKNWTLKSAGSVPSWNTTATDNKIEIWRTGYKGVLAQEGNQFFEMNATQSAAIYQEVCLDPGSVVKWSVYHRGRAGVDMAEVKIGGSLATATTKATMTDGTSAWGYYSGSYTVPVGQTTTFFVFESISTAGSASVGNFLDNFQITCDQDGDGVTDSDDDYPTDPNRAYKSFFPTDGKQIVAFEDLWPSLGDFDFNDMILSNQVEIAKNANGDLVDAKFKISIDAIGAGIHNGVALMLYNGSNTAFGSNVIASVSGDVALDPSNTNGLIVSNDIFATISSYYQNNGTGPSATPDTLEFTVNFSSSAGSNFTPELYLFRANDRSHEIHLSGNPTTSTLNTALLSTNDDNGNYKTANGLPWGIEIFTANSYQHPLEKIDILIAYSQFQQWATSGGADNTTWYNTPDATKVFGN